jgi:hypothetical protein
MLFSPHFGAEAGLFFGGEVVVYPSVLRGVVAVMCSAIRR